MIDLLRNVLFFCQVLFLGFILIVLGVWIHAVYERLRYKKAIPFDELLHPIRGLSSSNGGRLVAIVVLSLGCLNLILGIIYGNSQIGSFFERDDYSERYEATLYIDEKPIFCLVDMYKSTDIEDVGQNRSRRVTTYWLGTLYLPYGRTELIDEEYDPDSSHNDVSIGTDSEWFDIILEKPADESSQKKLDAVVVASYGDCCASRQSDVYHANSCPIAQNIKPSNLIFFSSTREAEAFGYSPCEHCNNW